MRNADGWTAASLNASYFSDEGMMIKTLTGMDVGEIIRTAITEDDTMN